MIKPKQMTKRRSQTGYPGVYRTPGAKTYYYSTYVTSDPYVTKRTNKAGFKTAHAAYEAKLEFEKKTRDELKIELNKHTIGYLVGKYLNWKKLSVKLSTYHHTEGLIIKYLSEPYSKIDIQNFCKTQSLVKYRKTILAANFSILQKNRIFGLVKEVFGFGYKTRLSSMHYYDKVAFELMKIPDNTEINPKKKENFWTIQEWQKFINSINENDKWYILFSLLAHLGCRVGELRGLQNKHIDIIGKTITIEQQALNNVGTGKSELASPKTKKSVRIVTISESMANLLNDYMTQLKCNNPNRFLFFNSKEPVGLSSIRREFEKYIKIANIKHITLHGIRHSNCTWLLSGHLNIQQIAQVSERLGHASRNETLNTYMHVNRVEDPSIMNTLDNVINSKGEKK